MTKLTYDADFRVHVRPETWENEGAESKFFEGIYTLALNSNVRISFVPDISHVCPPWRQDALPDGRELSSEREARLFQVLTSDYSVTPNPSRAGHEEVVRLLPGHVPRELDPLGPEIEDGKDGVVWYVTSDEWQALTTELEELSEVAYAERHFVRFSQIQGTRLARFLEERFLPSGRLSPLHREVLHLRRA